MNELSFLQTALPEDWAAYPRALLETFAAHARMLRETVPWCAALSEEAYQQYVLCPRVNDEDLSEHRALFHNLLWDRVKGKTVEEAVQEVNRWCHEHASYQAQDDRTASPLTVFRCGSGRCGEESAFLVATLRSVGLPARQVYAPRWSHCDDNHAWVEVLCEGRWRFLGACEPEPVLDRGWFNTAASRAMLVHSRTFGPAEDTALHGPVLDRRGQAVYHNQTARYAPVKTYTFRTAPGGTVTLEILNEARFVPVAVLPAGADGTVAVELGIGDLRAASVGPGGCAETICHGAQEDGADLTRLSAPAPEGRWVEFEFRAPAPTAPRALSGAEQEARRQVLAHGNALREARLAGFFREGPAARCPGMENALRAARGNFDEVCAFLTRDEDPLRAALVGVLADKDLRDVTADCLEVHLRRAAPWAGQFPEEVFRRCLLNPRVAFERLTDWSTVPAGPVGTVIRLRQSGTPARLRPLDGAVERWRDGAFEPLEPEKTGTAVFTKGGGERFTYRQNWSLARWTGGGWQDLWLDDGAWQGDRMTASLPVGRYRVITALRLPGGDQLAARLDVSVARGERKEVPLYLRRCGPADLITRRPFPLSDGAPPAGRCTLLVWLEEGAEPTEHLLGELAGQRKALRALPLEIRFRLRSRGAERQRTLAALLAEWPEIVLEYPDWNRQVETAAQALNCDPERPPLAVVCGRDGQAAYAASGYSVGGADLLRRVAEELCRQGSEA